jgi:hypothetical protein
MKGWRLKEITWIGFFAAVAWIVFAPHASAAGLAVPPAQDANPTPDVGTLLAPLLAAATGIERVVEMLWNYFESAAQQVAATLGLGRTWASYARGQIVNAEAALTTLAQQALAIEAKLGKLPPRPDPAAVAADPASREVEQNWLQTLGERANIVQRIDDAQATVQDAQQQLLNSLKSARYKSIKQALSVLISLSLGLVTSFTTNLDIFNLLHLTKAASIFGVVLTGLIIGAGSGPVHSLIGILQQSRDTLDQAANLFSSRARSNATEQYATLMQANAAATAQAAPESAAASRELAPITATNPTPTQQQLRTIERLAQR